MTSLRREAEALAHKIVARSCTQFYANDGGHIQNVPFLEKEIVDALLAQRREEVEAMRLSIDGLSIFSEPAVQRMLWQRLKELE